MPARPSGGSVVQVSCLLYRFCLSYGTIKNREANKPDSVSTVIYLSNLPRSAHPILHRVIGRAALDHCYTWSCTRTGFTLHHPVTGMNGGLLHRLFTFSPGKPEVVCFLWHWPLQRICSSAPAVNPAFTAGEPAAYCSWVSGLSSPGRRSDSLCFPEKNFI